MTTAGSGIVCLLACDGDAAVGFAILSRDSFAWTGKMYSTCRIPHVDETARGQGVRAPMDAVYAHADATGAAQVFWMADEDDARLQAFDDRKAKRSPDVRYLRRALALLIGGDGGDEARRIRPSRGIRGARPVAHRVGGRC